MKSWDFSRSVGAGSATMRNTRGLTLSVIALMTPPLPAVSRPSKTNMIRNPSCCTQSCSFTSSPCSFFTCSSYSLFFIFSRFSSAAGVAALAPLRAAFAARPASLLFAAICLTSVMTARNWRRSPSMRLVPLVILQVPAAAERLVETHHCDELIPLGLSQRVFGGEQRLLRIEHLEVVGATSRVALRGEVDRLTVRLHLPLERSSLCNQCLLRDERIGCLAERARHCLLVLRNALVPERFLGLDGGFQPTPLEDRAGEAGSDAPDAEIALEQVRDVHPLGAVQGRQSTARIIIGHRDADLGIGADHDLLRLHDVGSALQQIAGEARRCRRHGLLLELRAALDVPRVASEQHTDRVLLLRDGAVERCDGSFARIVGGLCAHHPELAVPSRFKPLGKEVERPLVYRGTLLGDRQLALELDQQEVIGGDIAHQGEHHAAAHVFLGVEAGGCSLGR